MTEKFYRAEQKPKKALAEKGGETFITYHKTKADSHARAEARELLEQSKPDEVNQYFKAQLVAITEDEFNNRPDLEPKETSYFDFNSDQDFVTTEDVLNLVAAMILFGDLENLDDEKLKQIETYVSTPSNQHERYVSSVEVITHILKFCFKDIPMDDDSPEIETELCKVVLAASDLSQFEMMQKGLDYLETQDIELVNDRVVELEKLFEQIDVSDVAPLLPPDDCVYLDVWDSIVERLMNRKSAKCTTAEVQAVYDLIAPQITEQTDVDQLCEKIKGLTKCGVLFDAMSCCQIVMQCQPQPENEKVESSNARSRLSSRFKKNEGKPKAEAKPENKGKSEAEPQCVSLAIHSIINHSSFNDCSAKYKPNKFFEVIRDNAMMVFKNHGEFPTNLICEHIEGMASVAELADFSTCESIFSGYMKTETETQNETQDEPQNETQGETQQAEQKSEPVSDESLSVTDSSSPIDLLDLPDFEDEVTQAESDFIEKDEPTSFDEQLAELNQKIAALAPNESLILYDLENDLYHACDGYSKSSLDAIDVDPAIIEWRKNCPVDTKKINSLNIGSALHTMVLEPHKFDSQYAIEPPVVNEKGKPTTKASNYWKGVYESFCEENKGKTIITHEEAYQLDLMKGSIFAYPKAKVLFTAESGQAEVSIFWHDPETGLIFKIRVDWMCEIDNFLFFVDLKSTHDARDFEKSIGNFRYHVQDAFYSWVGFNALKKNPIFAFCVNGKSIELGRYPTRLVVLKEEEKTEGAAQFRKNIRTLQGCIQTGNWGGFEEVERPGFQKKNDLVRYHENAAYHQQKSNMNGNAEI